MAINVMEDITELKRAEQGQRLLAEVGKIIAASMDSERILQRVTDLAVVPWLSDWCSVHVIDDEGAIVMSAHASSQSENAEAILELDRRFPAQPGERGVPHVLETGRDRAVPRRDSRDDRGGGPLTRAPRPDPASQPRTRR